MASDSQGDARVGVDLPADLREWLDERADALGVDRAELVTQVVASYHAAATLDGELDAAGLLELEADDFVDVEAAVSEAVEERIAEAFSERVDERIAERVDEAVDERLAAAVESRFDEVAEARRTALEDLDAEFQAKIEDVRSRVVQVKRETDGKAPADHDHAALDAIGPLEARVEELAEDLGDLREEVTDRLAEREAADDDVTERLDDLDGKLTRVAWVVSDLREETTGRGANERALDGIKRAAAQEGVSRAACERCGETVHVGLLTEPECPHCNAAVSDVRPTGGILRKKARLVAASQLGSGREGEDA